MALVVGRGQWALGSEEAVGSGRVSGAVSGKTGPGGGGADKAHGAASLRSMPPDGPSLDPSAVLGPQERAGVPSRHEQTAVSFLEGMAEAAIANPAAVDEQVLQLGVAAFTGRVRHIAAKLRRSGLHFDDVEPVAHFRAEEQADTA